MWEPQRTGGRLLNSVKRTCERLDLGHTTVYKLIGDGMLDTVKVGGKTLITEDSILRLSKPELDPKQHEAA